jgi:hypothetical protein
LLEPFYLATIKELGKATSSTRIMLKSVDKMPTYLNQGRILCYGHGT